MKQGVRILALDDSSFSKKDKTARVFGLIARNEEIEGAVSFLVGVDGKDATEKIIKAVKGSRFKSQIKIIALHSILFAGLNIIDVLRIRKELGVEVIAITRKKPRKGALLGAFEAAKVAGMEWRKKVLKQIEDQTASCRTMGFYVVCTKGISKVEAKSVAQRALPLLRLAHIIASAVSSGESRGRL